MKKILSTYFGVSTLLYALLLLTPFLFSNIFNESFEFPKMYFVYFTGSLLTLIVFLGKIWKFLKDKSLIDILTLSFVFSFVLSTLFSTHLYTSLWGYFSRFNGGLISVLIFFGIYQSVSQINPNTLKLIKLVSLTLVPTSLYSIMQHFGLGGTWSSDTTVRSFSTFGQANWYAAYCAMVLPLALYLGLHESGNQNPNSKKTLKYPLWFLLYFAGFAAFWFSYSLSGLLGLTVSTLLVLYLNKDLVRKKRLAVLATFATCIIFAALNPGIFGQRVSDIAKDAFGIINKPNKSETLVENTENDPSDQNDTNTPPVPKNYPLLMETTNYNISDSGRIRKWLWIGTLRLWLSSPKNIFIGTGPETFPYEFQLFRPSQLNYSSEWNFILNKPHNYYLELLAQNGVVGLIIYLAIVIKTLLAKHPALTPALMGLFITNIFGWPTVYTSLLFWVFLALIKPGIKTQNLVSYANPVKILLSAVILSLYLFLNISFVRHVMSEVFSKASANYFDLGNATTSLKYINISTKLNPNEPYYYRQRAKTYILILATKEHKEEKKVIKKLALDDILKAQEKNPKNLATLRGVIPLYYMLAIKDMNSLLTQKQQTDEFYLEIAKTYYLNLSTKYPNDVGILTQIAKYQKMLGLSDDYKETLVRVNKLRPDLLHWYIKE